MASFPIQGLSFDVGGTLIDVWPSVGHAYARVAARHGCADLEPSLLTERFLAAWRERSPGFDYSRDSWAAVVRSTFAHAGALAQDPVFFHDLYNHFAKAEPWRVYPDVVPILQTLRLRGFKLAVTSNWDDRLRPLLGDLQLLSYFDYITVSGELGVHKPHRAIFSATANGLGLPPDSIVHVGDHWTEDVLGARAAGMKAVHLRRGGIQGSEGVEGLGELWAYLGVDGRGGGGEPNLGSGSGQ